MNEALRLLRRVLRRNGYDLRKIRDYDLLQLKNAEAIEGAGNLAGQRAQLTGDQEKIASGRLDRLLICYRTCVRGDPRRPSGRITGASVVDNVLHCLTSTIESVNAAVTERGAEAVEIVLLDDHSDETALARIKAVLAKARCPSSVKTTRKQGQGASLLEQFEYAKGKDALVYFCEDDHLHVPGAIPDMWDFYNQVHARIDKHMLLHPADYPDRYKNIYPSYILLGRNSHWRSISHSTHTMFTHGKVVEHYWDCFYNTRLIGIKRGGEESKTTNLLFDHIPGFSPIPSLACHLQSEATMPPFFDWRTLWDNYDFNG